MAVLGVLAEKSRIPGDQVTRARPSRWAWRGGEGSLARCTVSGGQRPGATGVQVAHIYTPSSGSSASAVTFQVMSFANGHLFTK